MFVIAGKNNIAVYALNYMSSTMDKNKVAVVINATDTGLDTWQMSLKKRALELKVKIISLDEAEQLASTFLSLEFDKLVNPEHFRTKEILNIHFSKLPAYKGMYTSVWPILNGEKKSAVTLHRIDAGIDTGGIIEQLVFPVDDTLTSKDLYLKYIRFAIDLFDCQASKILKKEYRSVDQKVVGSTYYSKLSVDFLLDLNQTAWMIGRQIRAYSFRDYQLPSVQGVRVANYEVLPSRTAKRAGTVLEDHDKHIVIATVDYDMVLFKDLSAELFSSCQNGDIDYVRKNINNIPSVDDQNDKSWTLLMVASYYGFLKIAVFLIEVGADVNAINYKGTSVLMYAKDYAISKRDTAVFDYLLNLGANETHQDYYGKSLLDYLDAADASFLGLTCSRLGEK